MIKLLRFLVLAILVSGCSFLMGVREAPPYYYVKAGSYSPIALREIDIWVDRDFGGADRISITDAIIQWNFALNGYVKLKVISYDFDMQEEVLEKVMHGGGWLILKIDSRNAMVHDSDKAMTLAFADSIGGNRLYIIRDRIDNAWVTGIVMHEIGHLLGARHDKAYLMQPHYHWGESRCVDYGSLVLVAAYQHLPIERLNYCVYGKEMVTEKPLPY
jgi:hypothetical protein